MKLESIVLPVFGTANVLKQRALNERHGVLSSLGLRNAGTKRRAVDRYTKDHRSIDSIDPSERIPGLGFVPKCQNI